MSDLHFQELVSTQMLSIVLTFLSSILVAHTIEKPIYSLVNNGVKSSLEEKEIEIK